MAFSAPHRAQETEREIAYVETGIGEWQVASRTSALAIVEVESACAAEYV